MNPDINEALEELLRHGLEGNFATFDEYDFDNGGDYATKQWSKYNIIPHPSHISHHGTKHSSSDEHQPSSDDPDSASWDPETTGSREQTFTPSEYSEDGHGIAVSRRGRNYQADLLLASLLEHLCSSNSPNAEYGQRLFRVISRQLVSMQMVEHGYFEDHMSSSRQMYRSAFLSLVQQGVNLMVSDSPASPSRPLAITDHNADNQVATRNGSGLSPFMATSRYKEDFTERERLGKGGYGAVFRVVNRLDGSAYAVKKIRLNESRPDVLAKALREVRGLARLDNIHVIRYHSAWMEHVYEERRARNVDTPSLFAISAPTTPAPLRSTYTHHSNGDNSHDDDQSYEVEIEDLTEDITFMRGPRRAPSNDDDTIVFENSGNNDMTRVGRDVDVSSITSVNTALPDRDTVKTPKKSAVSADSAPAEWVLVPRLYLFIHMQLCASTLAQWVSKRNASSKPDQAPECAVDVMECRRIFRELVEGVQYIHSQGLIHRDIKPSNIFFSDPDQTVKIGDFGLLTDCMDAFDGDNTCKSGVVQSGSSSLTRGVGTATYASPEQLKGTLYNEKCDIYSLGMVMLELFWPMGTGMERATVMKSIRDGKMPIGFARAFPQESMVVKILTDADPNKRPDAATLLTILAALDSADGQSKTSPEYDATALSYTKVSTGSAIDENQMLQHRIADLEAQIADLKRRLDGTRGASPLTTTFAPPARNLSFLDDSFKAPADPSFRRAKPSSSKAFTRENRSLSTQATSSSTMAQASSPPLKRASVHRVDTCPGSLESFDVVGSGKSTGPPTHNTTPDLALLSKVRSRSKVQSSSSNPISDEAIPKRHARIARTQSIGRDPHAQDHRDEPLMRPANEKIPPASHADEQRRLNTALEQLRSKSIPTQSVGQNAHGSNWPIVPPRQPTQFEPIMPWSINRLPENVEPSPNWASREPSLDDIIPISQPINSERPKSKIFFVLPQHKDSPTPTTTPDNSDTTADVLFSNSDDTLDSNSDTSTASAVNTVRCGCSHAVSTAHGLPEWQSTSRYRLPRCNSSCW